MKRAVQLSCWFWTLLLPRIHWRSSLQKSLLSAHTDVCERGRCWQCLRMLSQLAARSLITRTFLSSRNLSFALTPLRGMPSGVSSLVNKENKTETLNRWQADFWRQSLRFPLESEGRNGVFRVQLFLSQGTFLHMLTRTISSQFH